MRCIIIDDDILTQNLMKSFVNKSGLITCEGVYNNPVEAQEIIKKNQIDLIFLDIEMPEMSGFDFLDTQNYFQQIIVISGSKKYALNTFEYGVTDYLLKPITYERFLKSLTKSIDKYISFNSCEHDDCIFVKKDNLYEKIKIDDIHCITLEDNIFNIETKDNIFCFTKKNQIGALLNKDFFIRINDSLVLNINRIIKASDTYVKIKTNGKTKTIPIEKEFSANLINKLNK